MYIDYRRIKCQYVVVGAFHCPHRTSLDDVDLSSSRTYIHNIIRYNVYTRASPIYINMYHSRVSRALPRRDRLYNIIY